MAYTFPITFNQFRKHTGYALAFVFLIVIGVMYRTGQTKDSEQVERLTTRVTELEDKYDALNKLFIKTMTELKQEDE